MKKVTLKDGTQVVLRPPKMSDLNAMNKTFNRSVRKHDYLHRITPSPLEDSRKWLKGVIDNIKKRKALALVAYSGDTYAGNVTLTLGKHREKRQGKFGVLVDEKFRGKGLGTLMMEQLIERAKKRKDIDFLTLGVYAPNKAAIALYKKLGFREVARMKDWLLDHDGSMIDEIVMRLDLK